ncbi:MAG: hypothetical protein QOF90_1538 [Acetobacteraceae bacterium]|jgi:hypothetical protein|nr:hypothetical protein [Acetobacteraceae bacterium]MEA2776132.1 hypothetical protein [Acetobacteraceae bacterium]
MLIGSASGCAPKPHLLELLMNIVDCALADAVRLLDQFVSGVLVTLDEA